MPDAPKPEDGSGPSSPYSGKIKLASAQSSAVEPPAPTSPINKAKGFIDGAISEVKGAASEVVKMGKQYAGQQEEKPGRRRAAELREAEAKETRRKREIEQESKLVKWQKRNLSQSRKGGR